MLEFFMLTGCWFVVTTIWSLLSGEDIHERNKRYIGTFIIFWVLVFIIKIFGGFKI